MATPLTVHNKNNFIVPVTITDREVFIRDVNGKSTDSINPLGVTFMYVNGINIILKTKGSDSLIEIDFSTNALNRIWFFFNIIIINYFRF